MAGPGQSSGTYTFNPSNASLMIDAFDRIRVRQAEITRHMANSARMSMNLMFVDWSNVGFNLWELQSGTIELATGTATYTMPANLEIVTEAWFSQANGYGTGSPNDRIMVPVTRTQYAMIPNKMEQGLPTQYWFNMLPAPVLTIWQPPVAGYTAPNYLIEWYGMSRIQDANLGSAEAPNLVYRALEAATADLALRLLTKFGPTQPAEHAMLQGMLTAEYRRAWDNLQTRDQEAGPILIQPNIGTYGRI